jgi:hypothetical protein
MNIKGYGRKWLWPNLKYYFRIFLEELKNITKNISQDCGKPGLDLNPGLPEYKAKMLTTRSRRQLALL